jgi:catechol 2,3-dioxygenase-like lactoylglutathione lyase family enzyme
MWCDLHHLHFKCSDMEGSVRFFKEVFDGEELSRIEFKGMPIVRMRVGGDIFSFSPKKAGEEVEVHPKADRYGLYHLGLQVKDVEKAVAELKQRGLTITQEPASVTEKLKVAFFLGPDDYSIELVEVKD